MSNIGTEIIPTHLVAPDQILQALCENFVNDIARIIKGYAVFDEDLDLSWCDINLYMGENMIKKSVLNQDQKHDCNNYRDGGNMNCTKKCNCVLVTETISDRVFLRKIHIESVVHKLSISEIMIRRYNNYGPDNVIMYWTLIYFKFDDGDDDDFCVSNDNAWTEWRRGFRYHVSFHFDQSYVRLLIDSKDYENFATWIREMYENSPSGWKTNEYLFKDLDMYYCTDESVIHTHEQNMKELWECWRKVIAPRIVLEILSESYDFK
jgi:hypothetical protein